MLIHSGSIAGYRLCSRTGVAVICSADCGVCLWGCWGFGVITRVLYGAGSYALLLVMIFCRSSRSATAPDIGHSTSYHGKNYVPN